MTLPVHTIDILDEANGFVLSDRVLMGLLPVAYAAGGSAGAIVTAPLPPFASLPATAAFFVSAAVGVTASVVGTPATGFKLNVGPQNPANTVAAGVVSVLIVA